MNRLIVLILIFVPVFLWGQKRTFFIQDESSKEPIPFVKVFPNHGNPFHADLDGAFQVDSTVVSVGLKYLGYEDTVIALDEIMEGIILFAPRTQLIEEVVVTPGENPAHRIIEKAIENRKKNHPLSDDAFSYKSYSKFIFDINREALDNIPENTKDSSLLKMRNFFANQHLFMMESVSERKFIPPYRDKEEILAYKVSGLSDPRLSTFASSMQSFSFYDNTFDLLGKKYINPIASGGIRRYLFILEDTTINAMDTTFTIFYRPRKGKDFDGVSGRLYINTNGFAVEKVIAEPYQDSSGVEMRIVQEYALIDGKKWFPIKLSTSLAMTSLSMSPTLSNAFLEGTGTTYIDSIRINPPGLEVKRSNITLATSENANELDSAQWEGIRKYRITDKEAQTYHVIDSLSSKHNLNERFGMLSSLLEGKIPIKKLDLDLERVLDFNEYEGLRLGAGLETSERLMKWSTIGGYVGYGFRDKALKYGGEFTVHFSRKRGQYLSFIYQQDVLERGRVGYSNTAFSLMNTDMYRDLFIAQMDQQRLGEIRLGTDIRSSMQLALIGDYQRITFTDDYAFKPSDSTVYSPLREFDLAEVGVEICWNIGAKYMLLGTKKVVTEAKYPLVKFKVMQGVKGWFESNYDYTRLSAEVGQTNTLRGIGAITWRITASKTIGEVPIQLLYNGNGTNSAWSLSVPNSFETMTAASFYTTEQVALFTRFDFTKFKTKAAWNEPQIGVHYAFGSGNFSGREMHQLDFETMHKGYQEVGLILNGLLVSSSSAIGIGGFYNIGAYASTDWRKNIVPKIAVKFQF